MTNLEWLTEKIEENKENEDNTIYESRAKEFQELITQQIIAKEFIKLNESLLKIKQIIKR